MKENNFSFKEWKDILSKIYLENPFKSLKEIHLKKLGIEYGIIDSVEGISDKAMIFVPTKDGMSVSYGFLTKRKYTEEYFYDFFYDFRLVNETHLELMNERYKKRKQEVDIMEEVYKSQKLRGLFAKMKTIDAK